MRLTGTSPHWHRMVALVSLTVVMSVTYTEARCPKCARQIMAVPGVGVLHVRQVANNADRSGRGPVVACNRCGTLCEVVEYVA